MKRVSSVLMAVCIFLVTILTCSLSAVAVGEFLIDYSASFVLDYCVDLISSSVGSLQARTEAARSYFFTYLTSNKYNYSGSIFTSKNTRFDDKYLDFVFDYYFEITYKHGFNEYDSNGDIFIQASGYSNTPFSLQLLGFVSGQMSNSDYFTEIDVEDYARSSFKNYYQSYLARYILEQGGEASDPNPGKSGLDIAPGYVSSDDLKEQIEKENAGYSPKGADLFYNSYRTDTNYHRENLPSGATDIMYNITLFQNPQTMESLTDLYCLPFYKAEDGTMYYCDYAFHYYWIENDDPNSDIALRVDVYQYNEYLGYIYDDEHSGIVYEGLSYAMPYQVRAAVFYGFGSTSFPKVTIVNNELDYSNLKASTCTVPYEKVPFLYYTSDYSDPLELFYYRTGNYTTLYSLFYNNKTNNFSYSGNPNKNNDYGFICSNEMITTVYSIDSSKIPSGQVVQINGDNNVYNYYITNPETGQSSTVNEFVENNYTYITNNNGEGSGTGGGLSGDINVGGSVDVNGNINVDVNINTSPSAYPDTDLVGNLPEAPQSFLDYLAVLFGSLPSVILTLLVGGIAAAIFCRIWGR